MDQWNSIVQRNKFKEGQYDPTEKVSSRGDWMKDVAKEVVETHICMLGQPC